MSADIRLTAKQRTLLDFMRGNGCCLDGAGRRSLKRRQCWNERAIAALISALVRKGYAYYDGNLEIPRLTKEGRRA